MDRVDTQLEGPILIRPEVHRDPRGFFVETYRRDRLAALGVEDDFVQDNHSRSEGGIVRGMHLQPGQAKLVRCARGSVWDAVVDVRRGSPTFGRWQGVELSDDNLLGLYIPDGFAHGFCVTSEVADVVYKTSAYYDPRVERGFAWDDPEVGIAWPLEELRPSERDRAAPPLREIAPELPFRYGG